jgi:hypothetical protein
MSTAKSALAIFTETPQTTYNPNPTPTPTFNPLATRRLQLHLNNTFPEQTQKPTATPQQTETPASTIDLTVGVNLQESSVHPDYYCCFRFNTCQ